MVAGYTLDGDQQLKKADDKANKKIESKKLEERKKLK